MYIPRLPLLKLYIFVFVFIGFFNIGSRIEQKIASLIYHIVSNILVDPGIHSIVPKNTFFKPVPRQR